MSKRLLFDTNVLIDLTISSRPQHDVAVLAFSGIFQGRHHAYALASSLKDVYYICHRHYGSESLARTIVTRLRSAFELIDLTDTLVDTALESDEADFEDGLVRAAAEYVGCSAIVSRDKGAYEHSTCSRLDPIEVEGFLRSE